MTSSALCWLDVQHLCDHDPEDPVELADALQVNNLVVVALGVPDVRKGISDQVQNGNTCK